jgi:hypothetical protein
MRKGRKTAVTVDFLVTIYTQQSDFLKSSEFLSKLHSLHTCQLLVFRIENGDS